jgi:two-component system sensor histidine kinase/response regulator
VAEDNPVNQLVIQGMLAKRGYDADIVGDGRAALDELDRSRHVAVLMDLQMPELDGYETTRRIRAAETGEQHLPIIAMTAAALEGDREAALQAGMDDHLAKPLRPDQLDAVLERWTGAAPPAEPILDESRIRNFRENYPDIAERLVALFVDTTPPLLEQLAEAASRDDLEAVRKVAHKLKGSCENVGATRMAAACRALEEAGGAQTPLVEPGGTLSPLVEAGGAVSPLVEAVRGAYAATLAELRGAFTTA